MSPRPESSIAAVVTGHSRGLGAAIAERLLERDVRVLGVSRRPNAALERQFPKLLSQEQLDLADADALLAWIKRGKLRRFLSKKANVMLVNNAGLLEPIGPLQSQRPADVALAASVNVGAALTLSAAFVQTSEGATDRRILHISSNAGRKAYAGWAVYCASKAALDHHARAVAMDGTPRLRVCSLAPGIVDTEMQAQIRSSTTELFPERQRFVDMKDEGRLHSPRDRGRLIVDLLLAPTFGDEIIADLPR